QAGQAGIALQSATTHACFLTHVAGRFQGGAENVLLNIVSGVWRMGATAQQAGVDVASRCMLMQPLSPISTMGFDTPSPVLLDRVITGACYLLRIEGDLGDEGDFL